MGATPEGATGLPRFINPETVHKPIGYTHVVEMTGPGRTVYLSGQIGVAPDFKPGGSIGDFRTQAALVFENLKNALAAVGAGFEHVVKMNVYLLDVAAHLAMYREVRDLHVNRHAPPAATLVQVPRLAIDGLLIEVEAIAFLPAM
jgi:enamine deaminase RidA (YjgF/YER057c/UK114 family)